MSYIGRDPQTVFGEYKKIDVSGWSFDSSTTTFPAGFQIGDTLMKIEKRVKRCKKM